jgi:hypothetical protein
MNIYHVRGNLEYLSTCGCSYCQGHDKDWPVDRLVKADSPDEAILKLWNIRGALPFDGDIDDNLLLEQLVATEPTPEFVMRALGMPALFDLEPAP